MQVFTFKEPPIDNNNYLIVDEETKDAALVDCSSYEIFSEIENILKETGAKLKYILLTHGHFDHVAGINQSSISYAANSEIKVFMHKNDLSLLSQVNNYLPMFGLPEISVPKIDKYIEDSEILKLGNTEIKVIHTPGHTQGGVCYYADNKLFSGDTIFKEAVGRCDLEGGNFEQLVENITDKIFVLPEDTKIYPGHGAETTIAWEKLHNRFL